MQNNTNKTEIDPVTTDSAEWHRIRSTGIGGSDIAAIVGLSPRQSSIDVWLQKKGLAPAKEESSAMHWGHNLEDVIAREYAEKTGFVVEPGVHLRNGFRLGNTDRMVPSQRRILEVKTASGFVAREWGTEGTDEIPDHYLCQVQWYLGLLDPADFNCADVPVLIGGNDFRIYHIERNDELIGQLIEAGERWWTDYIVGDKAPEPDGTICDMRSRLILHPKDNGRMLDATPELDDLARKLDEAKAVLTSAEGQVEDLELQMKTIIGDASGVAGADWSCTWKKSKDSKATDWKAACTKAGVSQDIIDACSTVKPGARRFLFKTKFD